MKEYDIDSFEYEESVHLILSRIEYLKNVKESLIAPGSIMILNNKDNNVVIDTTLSDCLLEGVEKELTLLYEDLESIKM